jgi:uncharacterized protein
MKGAQAMQRLAASAAEFAQRREVTRLALLRSVVRDAAQADSDVDSLVAFGGPATSTRCFGVQFFLDDPLGHRVDRITDNALHATLRPIVEREAVQV